MADVTDQNLIRAYVRGRCEQSFGELVHRHVDFVHFTALRVLRDASLAEDVTQRVFLALAQHSVKLQDRISLTGWLHETARNVAINTVRGEERRRLREQEAASMNDPGSTDTDTLWQHIALHLDEALAQLNGTEREVILWRYFERRTAEQIGGRLGLTAEAAQKRVARALDRLREILANRGLTAPAASLAMLLSTQAVQSAPVGLAASSIATVSAANVLSPATSTLQIIMASTKIKIALAALVAAIVTTPLLIQHQKNSRLKKELTSLREQGPKLDHLRGELERQTAATQSAAEQRDKERAELARLRAEVTTLTARETKTATVKPPGQADASTNGALVRAEECSNVGFQTPSSTAQSLQWAKMHNDTNIIAAALAWRDQHTRAGIEAVFATAPESVRNKYQTADAYILSLFNHSGPQDAPHTFVSYRVLDEWINGDEATLQLEYNYADGSSFTSPQRYVRIGDNWRQTLEFDAPSVGKLHTGLQEEGTAERPSGSN